MNKVSLVIALIFLSFISIFAQSNVQQIFETEQSFARTADEKNTKTAFLEFIADDGILFQPEAVNGKEYWSSRSDSDGILRWNPVFADISANGVLGYTTGPWSYSPNREEKNPTSFGEFITIWQRQPDGKYKFVLDIGITHGKPESIEKQLKNSDNKTSVIDKIPVSSVSNTFYDLVTEKSLSEAYKMFLADDVRLYREGKFPFLGKNSALAQAKKEKDNVTFGKKMTLQSAGDLAYSNVTYESRKNGKPVEKGNTVQIWSYRNGKWQIVVDIFHPTPEKKN